MTAFQKHGGLKEDFENFRWPRGSGKRNQGGKTSQVLLETIGLCFSKTAGWQCQPDCH